MLRLCLPNHMLTIYKINVYQCLYKFGLGDINIWMLDSMDSINVWMLDCRLE